MASQQVLEQKTIEKAVEITQKAEDVVPIAVIVEKRATEPVTATAAKTERAAKKAETTARELVESTAEKSAQTEEAAGAEAETEKVAKTSKIKTVIERQKAKRVSQKITRRAAKAERIAARSSRKAARKAAAAKNIEGAMTKAAVETKIEAKAAVKSTAKIAERSFKVPHLRGQAATGATSQAETAQKAAKAQKPEKPAKITPRTNIPGMISTASLKKSATTRPMPSSVFTRRNSNSKPTRADLINAESRLGSQLFGAVPEGHRREFFHDKKNIWIWHEDWVDEMEHERQMTIRYEVRTSGVYKKVAAGKYFKLEGEELENFRKATHAYLYVIKKYLYNHPYSNVRSVA